MALIGLLLLWVCYAAFSGSIRFSGTNLTVILWFGVALVLFGAVVTYLCVAWKPKHYYEVYERGIVIKRRGNDVALCFDEIEDVLVFAEGYNYELVRPNFLAFRNNQNSEWFAITPRFKNHYDFIEGFVSLHTEQRGVEVLKQIEQTGFASFRHIDQAVIAKSKFSPTVFKAFIDSLGNYMNKYAQCKTLQLARDHIKINDQEVYFDDTDYLVVDGILSTSIKIDDSTGENKLSIAYKSVFSADILIALLSRWLNIKEQRA
ncbi:MAG: hypothetical protein LBT71_08750 [Azoarcus sp.]|jgi:hypothetical protein|nr:hypothetical protein [Azoarcus sp.]